MRRKGYVYRSMFLSYILMLLIPVMASTALYCYTYEVMKSQVGNHNRDLMVTIKSTCDREFEYYQGVLQRIYLHDMVRQLLSSKSEREQEDGWKVLQVKEALTDAYSDILSHSQHCRDLFVYIEKNDKIIGSAGAVSLDLCSKSYYEDGDVDELRSFLQEASSGDTLSYRPYTGGEYILLVKRLINANGRNADAVAGIWINTEDLDTRINSIGWNYRSDWTVMSDKGDLFRHIELLEEQDFDLLSLYNNGDARTINGVDYLIDVMESEVLDLSYVLFTLETEVSDSAKRIRTGYLFCLLLSLVIGIRISKVFAQKHYDPLQKIFAVFTKDEDVNIKNEYSYLEEQISMLVNSHRNICKETKKKEDLLRKYMLEGMLFGYGIEYNASRECEELYLKLNKGYNLVLLCSIFADYNVSDDMEEFDDEKKQKQFIISGIYAEEIGEKYDLEVVELEDEFALVIHLESKQEGYSEILLEIAERLHVLIAESISCRVYIMEGGLYQGAEGIRKSYLEACYAEDFLHYVDEIYLRYEDIKNLLVHKYDYSFEMEERVINAIRDGNSKAAVSFINSVLDNNFDKNEHYSSEMLTCLVYDVLGTLIKAGEEQGFRNDKLLNLHHIDVETSIEDIKRFFGDIVQEICDKEETVSASDNKRNKKLSRDIREFVRENYMDPNLNVSQTALHFGVTPSYLSAIFKKNTGKSIMEVIEQERIKNAWKLLEEGMSVADVAVRVGFRERTTFIRSFKRSTGVTPGSIKKVKSDSL